MSCRIRCSALALLLLVFGCKYQRTHYDVETMERTICDPAWPQVSEPVPKQSAADLLDQIKDRATAAGKTALAEEAEKRKNWKFTFTPTGGEAVAYSGPQGWARILVAYRYAEMGAGDEVNFDYALQELQTGGEGVHDPGWAAGASWGPSMHVGHYLDRIESNAKNTPAPPVLKSQILALVDKLKCGRGDIDECYGVPLTDQVAWARVVLAYYTSTYGPIWQVCSKELDHIEN